jgi:hypothetical protein
MNILGKCKLYAKEFNGKITYSTSINRKEQDGTYKNMYIQVQMPKDITIENNIEINITKGFITFYEDKNNLSHIKFVVMEFKIDNCEKEEREAIQNENDYTLNIDDLPF